MAITKLRLPISIFLLTLCGIKSYSQSWSWAKKAVEIAPFIGNAQDVNTNAIRNEIRLEVGHSSSVFFSNKNTPDLDFNYPFYVPSFFNLSMDFKNHLSLSATYKRHSYNPFKRSDLEKGELSYRQYHAFDFAVGYNQYTKNRKYVFKNYIMLSARPSGTEAVYLGYFYERSNNNLYSYESCGLGVRSSISRKFYNSIVLTTSLDFNYYFESNKLRSVGAPLDRDFNARYKVNRSMLTPALSIGYYLELD